MEEIVETHESSDGGVLFPFHYHPLYPTNDSSARPCDGCHEVRVDPTEGYTCHDEKIIDGDIHGYGCNIYVHKGCHEIINPSHPTHPLSLTRGYHYCIICGDYLSYMYLCSFSGFYVCGKCARKPFIIDPKRSHEHPLLVILKGSFSFRCDACGVNAPGSGLCLCIQCRFTIHRECVNLPRVIGINRHDHRVSHVPHLGPENWSCGICRKKVNRKYGAYSCSTCTLVFHAKCATRPDVWDKIELEGVPEDDPADIAPFIVVEEGVIKHFAHEHNLRFINVDDIVHDKRKQCYGCVLPIFSNPCYLCTHCDFILHETCANLPRKKRHPSHFRRLILYEKSQKQDGVDNGGHPFKCIACNQHCSGFAYVDDHRWSVFKIDVRCASIYDGYVHKSQPHSMLVVPDNYESYDENECSRCGQRGKYVWCFTERDDLFMCFKCATIPLVIKYKYDDHLLSLRFSEKAGENYWCDICERIVNPQKWFYTCDECSTTLHIDCVLGNDPYLRIGFTFQLNQLTLEVVSNDHASRPHCFTCSSRIEAVLVYKSNDVYFCSLWCVCRDM